MSRYDFFLCAAADGTLRTVPRGIFAALCLASVLKIKNHRQSRRYFCEHMYIGSLHTSASMMGAPFHLHSSRNIFLTLSCALRKILSIDISVQIQWDMCFVALRQKSAARKSQLGNRPIPASAGASWCAHGDSSECPERAFFIYHRLSELKPLPKYPQQSPKRR